MAIGRTRQTLEQLGRSLERDVASGQLRIREGAAHADDASAGVEAARWQLSMASDTARELELNLAEAQRLISGMSLEGEQ